MDQHRHHVPGFFAHHAEAEGAVLTLVGRGLGRDQLLLFNADSGPAICETRGESNEVLINVLVDGAIGTAVGTCIGGLAQLALLTGGVSLLATNPLIAPMVMLGWSASIGAFVGAAAGANAGVEHKDGWTPDLIHDAIASGQVVLVVHTRTAEETKIAREVIGAAVGEFKDVGSTV